MPTQNTVIHDPKNDVIDGDLDEDIKYRYNSSCECVDCLRSTDAQLEDEYLQMHMRVHLDNSYWD